MALTLKQIYEFFKGKGFSEFLEKQGIGLDLYVEISDIEGWFTVGQIHGPGSQQVPDLLKDIEAQIIMDYFTGNPDKYQILIADSEKEFTITEL